MNCKDVNRLMLQYFDNELPKDVANEFENHLTVCPLCKLTFDNLKSIYQIINEEKQEKIESLDIAELIIAKVPVHRISPAHSKSIRYFAFPGLAAASIALGIIIGSLFINSGTLQWTTYTGTDTIELMAEEYFTSTENNPYNIIIEETE